MDTDYEIIIIGAGVVGLAIAYSLADRNISSVLIVDKEPVYGRGISSRNSEVIHSGIYYPSSFKKTHYCIRGRELLYEFCRKHQISYSMCGKLVVGQAGQESAIEQLFEQAKENRIPEIYLIEESEIRSLEPDIRAKYALFVGCTGIISAHELMSVFSRISQNADYDFLFRASVTDADFNNDYYSLTVHGPGDAKNDVTCRWVINAGGLNSDEIAKFILGNRHNHVPKIRYSKGSYFKLASKWRHRIQRLIYPVPDTEHDAVGIHLCIDTGGDLRLGPNAEFLESRNEKYSVDPDLQQIFYTEGKRYIPGLTFDDLSPDFAGIRPKLINTGSGSEDFYIMHEEESGFPGWINLVGIDSPGLTSAIAIGSDIAEWVSTST